MYFLITIKNTGDTHDYHKAITHIRNSYRVLEEYIGDNHSHLLVETSILPDITFYHRYFRAYVHFRKVKDFLSDIERVKKYIKKHKEEVCGKMDVGYVKVWVKKREDGKVVLTIQAPEWFDLSRNRLVVAWDWNEFKQFVKYIGEETGLFKRKGGASQQESKQAGNGNRSGYSGKKGGYSKKSGSYTKKSGNSGYKKRSYSKGKSVKKVKGFNKAVKRD